MSLSIRFLGTVASRPTVERSVASLAVTREGETLLFDCGEGTQRQMMRYGVSFALADIFITHWHHDHFLGLLGLVRTLSLQGRLEPLTVWGPKGGARILRQVEAVSNDRLSFELAVKELAPGETIERKEYAIVPYAVSHGNAGAMGYALAEHERRGRFNVELARELGIPEGPLWGRVHKGEAITLSDGRVIQPSTLVGATRTGRKIVYTGDTRPCDATIDIARAADVLIHEATFSDEEAERAIETGHSTAREAAIVATRAGVKRLILTHVSARFSRDTSPLDQQAKTEFAATSIARDGLEIELPFEPES